MKYNREQSRDVIVQLNKIFQMITTVWFTRHATPSDTRCNHHAIFQLNEIFQTGWELQFDLREMQLVQWRSGANVCKLWNVGYSPSVAVHCVPWAQEVGKFFPTQNFPTCNPLGLLRYWWIFQLSSDFPKLVMMLPT